ncbi:GAF domain-containing protein [Streptomyces sp. NPDC032940]|uniref:GAF domain-containing protein n=1 Tax=Streptomyces sp. NPDC032940 TaxID=3155366 RepID=UPI0033E2D060
MAGESRLRITGHRGWPADAVEQLDHPPLDTVLTPPGRALGSGVPAFFSDPAEMRRIHPEAFLASGKEAWAFLPLIVPGRPVEVCVLSYDGPHAFSAADRVVLTSPAGLIAQALDRARLYDTKHDLAQPSAGAPAPYPPRAHRPAGGRSLSACHPWHGHRRRCLRPRPARNRRGRRRHRRRSGTQRRPTDTGGCSAPVSATRFRRARRQRREHRRPVLAPGAPGVARRVRLTGRRRLLFRSVPSHAAGWPGPGSVRSRAGRRRPPRSACQPVDQAGELRGCLQMD